MSGHPRTWFVVLPDIEAPSVVAAVRDLGDAQVLHHPSGRPWLIGEWSHEGLVTATVRSVGLVVLGHATIDAAALRHHAERLRDAADAQSLTAHLAGSCHVLVSAHGTVRAHGTLSGLRRLYHAELGGVAVAADRADVLARLTGQSIATDRLALRLLHPLPHPLQNLPLWPGVRAVSPDDCLVLARDRPALTQRRWLPPAPVRAAAEAAEALGLALKRAVAARTRHGGLVACDLSGGLDSTPLCFLAARGPGELLTVTLGSVDPHHDDRRWADLAAGLLPGARLLLDADRIPAMFAGMDHPGRPGDEPYAWTRTRARDEFLARELAARGASMRISGEGGDEILQVLPGYLRRIAPRHPLRAWQQLRRHRARYRWDLGGALGALADRRPYRTWLAESAAQVDHGRPPQGTTVLGWGLPPRLPPWATAEAALAVREQLRAAAAQAEPLAPEHAQHQVLHMVRHSAGAMRLAIEATAEVGAPYTAPFLDDQVIDACLAADLTVRGDPSAYKGLLIRAMGATVPEKLLRRPGKGDFSPDAHQGLAHHRRELAELLDSSALAQAGLIDPTGLRQACLGLYPPGTSYAALDATLACEHWLRARTSQRTTSTAPHPGGP